MKTKKTMTKLALALGTVASVAAPIAAVVSCGGGTTAVAAVSATDIQNDASAQAIKAKFAAGTFSTDSIRIIGHKREVEEQSKAAVAEFNKAFGTNIKINQVGGATDYGTYLTDQFQGGSKNIGLVGLEQLGDAKTIKNYVQNTEASDMLGKTITDVGALTAKDKNGADVTLMSAASEALGVIFNEDVFDKDGIHVKYTEAIPSGATDTDGFDEATGNLYASHLQKEGYLGLTAFIKGKGQTPFYSTYQVNGNDVWPVTNHLLSAAMKVNGITDATLANSAKNSATNVLTDGVKASMNDALEIYKSSGSKAGAAASMDEGMSLLATGQVAMSQNGTWAFDQIKQSNSNPHVGFLPMPVFKGTDKNAQFMKGTTQKWALTTTDEKVKKTIQMFLQWLYTSDTGVTALEADFGSITPYGLGTTDTSKITNTLIDSAGKYADPSVVTDGALALGNLPEGFNNASAELTKAVNSGTFDLPSAQTEYTKLKTHAKS